MLLQPSKKPSARWIRAARAGLQNPITHDGFRRTACIIRHGKRDAVAGRPHIHWYIPATVRPERSTHYRSGLWLSAPYVYSSNRAQRFFPAFSISFSGSSVAKHRASSKVCSKSLAASRREYPRRNKPSRFRIRCSGIFVRYPIKLIAYSLRRKTLRMLGQGAFG